MAVTLETATNTAAINAACDAIVDLLDAGAGAGYMEFQISGNTEVATVTFSDPAFGAASGGVATANSITSDTNATGNATAVTIFQWFDSDANLILSGSVAESGADINLDDGTPGGGVVIGASDTVTISALTFTVT